MDDNECPEAVGYKRPPRAHRFTKGKSGNPKGRPKGAKKIAAPLKFLDMVLAESQRTVRASDGEILTMSQALVRMNFQRAVSTGAPSAIKAAIAMLAELNKNEVYFADIPPDEELENITPEAALKAYRRMLGVSR